MHDIIPVCLCEGKDDTGRRKEESSVRLKLKLKD
jgi:hypothetical protein